MNRKLNATRITILNYLKKNINQFSGIKLKVITVIDQTNICDDPGNEELYLAQIAPEDDNINIYDHEPLINTRKLSDYMQELDIANEDGVLYVESPICLNTSVLLPITILK